MVNKNLNINGKNEGLSKICWGESGKRWKGVSPSPSIGHQIMEPFQGHQAMEPSIGHRVKIFLHLLPSPSLQKGEFGSFGTFFRT
jgi:hypothetical protein